MTNFSHALGHREDLIGLLVEHQMVVSEARPTHVPVEVLGFQVKREDVGEQPV